MISREWICCQPVGIWHTLEFLLHSGISPCWRLCDCLLCILAVHSPGSCCGHCNLLSRNVEYGFEWVNVKSSLHLQVYSRESREWLVRLECGWYVLINWYVFVHSFISGFLSLYLAAAYLGRLLNDRKVKGLFVRLLLLTAGSGCGFYLLNTYVQPASRRMVSCSWMDWYSV